MPQYVSAPHIGATMMSGWSAASASMLISLSTSPSDVKSSGSARPIAGSGSPSARRNGPNTPSTSTPYSQSPPAIVLWAAMLSGASSSVCGHVAVVGERPARVGRGGVGAAGAARRRRCRRRSRRTPQSAATRTARAMVGSLYIAGERRRPWAEIVKSAEHSVEPRASRRRSPPRSGAEPRASSRSAGTNSVASANRRSGSSMTPWLVVLVDGRTRPSRPPRARRPGPDRGRTGSSSARSRTAAGYSGGGPRAGAHDTVMDWPTSEHDSRRDEQVGGVGVVLGVGCVGDAEDVAGQLDHEVLEAGARPEQRAVGLAGVADHARARRPCCGTGCRARSRTRRSRRGRRAAGRGRRRWRSTRRWSRRRRPDPPRRRRGPPRGRWRRGWRCRAAGRRSTAIGWRASRMVARRSRRRASGFGATRSCGGEVTATRFARNENTF